MAYTKQYFTTGQVLTADHMNHIEDGIAEAVTVEEMNQAISDAINEALSGGSLTSAEEVSF